MSGRGNQKAKAKHNPRTRQTVNRQLNQQQGRQGVPLNQVVRPCEKPWVLNVQVRSLSKTQWPALPVRITATNTGGGLGDRNANTSHADELSTAVRFSGAGAGTFDITAALDNAESGDWKVINTQTQSVPYDRHVVIIDVIRKSWIKLHVIDVTDDTAPVALPGCTFQMTLPGSGETGPLSAADAVEIEILDPAVNGTAEIKKLLDPAGSQGWVMVSVESA